MGRGRIKRLRIRLRSADREQLVGDLGPGLFEDGLLVASGADIEVGARVHLELQYVDGRLALSGEGVVAARPPEPGGLLHLQMEWDPACRPVLYWVIARATEPAWDVHVAPSAPPSPAVTDLGPPPEASDTGDLAAALDDPDSNEAEPASPAAGSLDWGQLVADPEPSLQLAFEAPVEEDGTPSEDLLPFDDSVSLDLPDVSEDLDEAEPLLLTEVVEEPGGGPPSLEDSSRTQYAFSRGARDELGPGPAPDDAFSSADVPPPPLPVAVAEEEREPGEVTPLARIELVRRSNSAVRAGDLAPPPPEMAGRVPPTAIPRKRQRPPLGPPSRRALGVDPGDQTTRVGVVERGAVRVVPSRRGAPGIPSAVFIDPSGKTIVGEPASRRLPWQPELGIHGTKRLIGRFFCAPRIESLKARSAATIGAAEEDEAALSIGEHFISFEEIEALVLKEAKASAAFSLQDELNRAVLTCPRAFGLRQRRALAVSGALAGLHVERVLSSPLAVVLGQLKTGRLPPGRYLVYELGAAFFDATVIDVGAHEARVVGAASDPELGGVELDHALADFLLEQMDKVQGVVPGSRSGLLDVMEAAEIAKCKLSSDSVTRVSIEHPADDGVSAFALELEVGRAEAERRFTPLVERTFELTEAALRIADSTPEDLMGVLAVGASTQVPLVRRGLEARFGDRLVELDPLTAAVEGAAWAAADIDSTAPFALHERLPASVRHRPREGAPQVVLERGEAWPCAGRFLHRVRSPDDLHVFLFEGETGDAERDEPLAHLVLDAPADAGDDPWTAEVQVDLSYDGRLEVRAQIADSGAPVEIREVQELSRALLRRHFGPPEAAVPSPPHGLFDRLLGALKSGSGRYP